MNVRTLLTITVATAMLTSGAAMASSIGLKLSGAGVVNDSTVKAGQPVSVDVYVQNDSLYTGFAFGFAVTSPDESVTSVVHIPDSAKGLNDGGDIKGHNGWQDHSIWNFGGVFAVEKDWDGAMPELLGFGGLSVNQEYQPHESQKVLSFDVVFPEPGLVKVDSAFYPPGGTWMFATPIPSAYEYPDFDGALIFRVVK